MPLRIQLDGDKVKACSYLVWAKSKLFMLKASMKLLNIKQDRRNYALEGVRIFISSIFGDDLVRIVAHGGLFVYVADMGNHRVQVLDEEGRFMFSFGSSGSAEGKFIYPIDIVYYNNKLYITNATSATAGTLDIYSPFGDFIIRHNITEGSPYRLAVGEDRIAVVLYNNPGIVKVYDLSFNLQYTLTGITSNTCTGIEIAEGKLFVAVDTSLFTDAYIKVFELSTGTLKTTMGHPTNKPYSYEGLAYSNGKLYGPALGRARIDIFNVASLSFESSFDSHDCPPGDGWGDTRGITVSKNNIWTTEWAGMDWIDGTVSVSINSKSVTGVGTLFAEEETISGTEEKRRVLEEGSFIFIQGYYVVDKIISNTSLTLTTPHLVGADNRFSYTTRDRVKKFSLNGSFVKSYGTGGIRERQFSCPTGIEVVDSKDIGTVGRETGTPDAENDPAEDNPPPITTTGSENVSQGGTTDFDIACGGCSIDWSVDDDSAAIGITINSSGILNIPVTVPCGTVITIGATSSGLIGGGVVQFPVAANPLSSKRVTVSCGSLTIVDEDGTPATDTIIRNGSNDYKTEGCCISGITWSASGTGASITQSGVLSASGSACGSLLVTATCASCGTSATQYVRVTNAGDWVSVESCDIQTPGCPMCYGCNSCTSCIAESGCETISGKYRYYVIWKRFCGCTSSPTLCTTYGTSLCSPLGNCPDEGYIGAGSSQKYEWQCV